MLVGVFGGDVIEQCIARKSQGRSGGWRTIMLFRRSELAFFVYGFAKSSRQNLRRDELEAFRMLADEVLKMDRAGLEAALANGTNIEVNLRWLSSTRAPPWGPCTRRRSV